MKVAIDVGNSGTKVFFRSTVGHPIRMFLANEYYVSDGAEQVTDEPEIQRPVLEISQSDIIDVQNIEFIYRKTEGKNAELCKMLEVPEDKSAKYIVGGNKAKEQFYSELERPLLVDKVSQRTTYISILAALNEISEIEEVTDGFEVGVLLPLNEITQGNISFIQKLMVGDHVVEVKGKYRTIQIKSVHVIGECYSSAVAFRYEWNGVKKQLIPSAITSGRTLIVNMGAGTTDVAQFESNGTFVERSKDSFSIGGNTVRENLIAKFRVKYKATPTVTNAEEAVKTGFMKIGNKVIDVYDMVCEAKNEMSVQLMDLIKRYCIAKSIQITDLSALICTGGGAIEEQVSDSRTIPSNCKYLQEFMKESAPFTEVISSDNPRWDDVIGAYVILNVVSKK